MSSPRSSARGLATAYISDSYSSGAIHRAVEAALNPQRSKWLARKRLQAEVWAPRFPCIGILNPAFWLLRTFLGIWGACGICHIGFAVQASSIAIFSTRDVVSVLTVLAAILLSAIRSEFPHRSGTGTFRGKAFPRKPADGSNFKRNVYTVMFLTSWLYNVTPTPHRSSSRRCPRRPPSRGRSSSVSRTLPSSCPPPCASDGAYVRP